MRKKEVEVFSKKMFYYESRDNGNPVILVHGISSSSAIFIRQIIDSVLSYQFRIIALDLVGYGNSDHSDYPEKDYTIKGLSRFLVEFCNVLELKNAVFIGHNIGGNVILESFNQLNNPKGLVLLSSAPFTNPFSKEIFIKNQVTELFSKMGVDDSEIHQIAASFVEKDTKYPDFIPEIIRLADNKTRQYFFESVEKGEYQDQVELIKKIKIPVAIYYGEFDQVINFDYVNSIEVPYLWRNLIQIISDTGHIFFYECPADFNVSIEAYLNTAFY